MITAETMPVVHQPWCTAHVDRDPEQGRLRGWCAGARTVEDVEVELNTSDGGTTSVEVYSQGDRTLTPQEARRVAAEIVRASLIAEGAGAAGVLVAGNVVRAVADATPLDTDAVEGLADLLGVPVTALFA